MHILNSKKGTYFLADTLINRHPDTETLIDIAKLSDKNSSLLQSHAGYLNVVILQLRC